MATAKVIDDFLPKDTKHNDAVDKEGTIGDLVNDVVDESDAGKSDNPDDAITELVDKQIAPDETVSHIVGEIIDNPDYKTIAKQRRNEAKKARKAEKEVKQARKEVKQAEKDAIQAEKDAQKQVKKLEKAIAKKQQTEERLSTAKDKAYDKLISKLESDLTDCDNIIIIESAGGSKKRRTRKSKKRRFLYRRRTRHNRNRINKFRKSRRSRRRKSSRRRRRSRRRRQR